MVRVLLWAPGGSGCTTWGPGISAHNLYKYVDPQKISPTLVHGVPEHTVMPTYKEQVFIPGFKNSPSFQYLVKSFKFLSSNKDRFDVLHGLSGYWYSLFPSLYARRLNIPVALKITTSGVGFFTHQRGAKKYAQKCMLPFAKWITCFIVLTDFMKEELLQFGIPEQTIFKIPNGVDTNRFKPLSDEKKKNLRKELGLSNSFTMVYTGGLRTRKGAHLLVPALVNLLQKALDCQLLIVGSEKEPGFFEKMQMEGKRSGVVNRVHHFPFSKEIEKFYQASDLFVLPSKNEGLSNSMLEAMSCGLPALCTNISGAKELIVESGVGKIIEEHSESIASCALVYSADRDFLTKQSIQARNVIEHNYSVSKILSMHYELFFKLKASKVSNT